MSERKVLNKYYPPDFDPSKLPRLKKERTRDGRKKEKSFNIRVMAPCNMRCLTCNEYIYKGRKFNSRLETVQGESYLGLRVYRMYIKCPRCLSEITFKTDMKNEDYELEHGATRNFDSIRLAERAETQRIEEERAELANNPMRVLEERTKQSQFEIEMHETLEDLRALRDRHAHVDTRSLLGDLEVVHKQKLESMEDEAERRLVESAFGKKVRQVVEVEKQSLGAQSSSLSDVASHSGHRLDKPSSSSASSHVAPITFAKPNSFIERDKASSSKSTFKQSPFAAKRTVFMSYDDDEDGATSWTPAEKKRSVEPTPVANDNDHPGSATSSSANTNPHNVADLASTCASNTLPTPTDLDSETVREFASNNAQPAELQSATSSGPRADTSSAVSQPIKAASAPSSTANSTHKGLNAALAGLKKSVIVRKK